MMKLPDHIAAIPGSLTIDLPPPKDIQQQTTYDFLLGEEKFDLLTNETWQLVSNVLIIRQTRSRLFLNFALDEMKIGNVLINVLT